MQTTCVLHACYMLQPCPAPSESCPQQAPPPACRHNPERYMQLVFAVSSVTMLVPVIFHLSQSKEKDSLDPNAPGVPMPDYSYHCEQFLGGQQASHLDASDLAHTWYFSSNSGVTQPKGLCCRQLLHW